MLVVHVALDAAASTYFQGLPLRWAPLAYHPRLARKRHAGVFAQSVAGLWLLQHALAHIGHDTAALATIDIDAHGRPYLPQGPAFSIAHSDDFAACALIQDSDDATRVGLDMEQPRAIPPARLARLASNADERATIAQQPRRFFDFWCAREATVKATGRVGLKRMRRIQLDADGAWLDDTCWTLQPLALAPGLTACLASDAPPADVQIHHLTAPA